MGGMDLSGAYIAIFMMFLIIILTRRKQKMLAVRQVLKSKNEKERIVMTEMAKKFIGKECLIYTFDQHQYTGTIREVSGNAMLLDNNSSMEAINLDFIARIREYPRGKNGKKKSVILD